MRGLVALAAALLVLSPWHATAQAPYPAKPVKIIVPAQPGGGLDLIGRTVGRPARPRAGAVVRRREPRRRRRRDRVDGDGARRARRLHADGGLRGTHGTNPAVRKLPYDAVSDFTPIAMVGGTPNMLVVHPSVPPADLQELLRLREEANAGKLNYGTGGMGTLTHLAHRAVQGGRRLRRCARCTTAASARRSPTCSAARSSAHAGPRGSAAAHPRGKMKPIAVTGLQRHRAAAGRADLRGVGLQGLRRRAVVRHRRPGEAAAGDHAAAQRRDQQGARRPRVARAAAAEAIEPMPMTPERVRRVHAGRHRALERARPGAQHLPGRIG